MVASPVMRARIVSGVAVSQTTCPDSRIARRLSSRSGAPPPAATTSRRVPAAKVGDHLGFQVAKGRFALLGKNPGDRLARPLLDLHVGVDPVPAQSLGQVSRKGRFSGGTVANQDKIHRFLTLLAVE